MVVEAAAYAQCMVAAAAVRKGREVVRDHGNRGVDEVQEMVATAAVRKGKGEGGQLLLWTPSPSTLCS